MLVDTLNIPATDNFENSDGLDKIIKTEFQHLWVRIINSKKENAWWEKQTLYFDQIVRAISTANAVAILRTETLMKGQRLDHDRFSKFMAFQDNRPVQEKQKISQTKSSARKVKGQLSENDRQQTADVSSLTIKTGQVRITYHSHLICCTLWIMNCRKSLYCVNDAPNFFSRIRIWRA